MTTRTDDPPSRLGLPLVLFAVLLVGLVNLGELAGWNAMLLQGRLADADGYLRLVRVLELRQGSPWFEDLTMRLAPPEGLVNQWTRPLDILILLPALALERIAGLSAPDALFVVGVAISPVLHVAAALAAAWGAQAIWPGRAPWYAVLFMAGAPAAATYSALGRPDHHALIILLLAIGLGAVLRALLPAGGARSAMVAGLAFGAGLWAGPEALIVIAPALLALGIIVIVAEDGTAFAAQGRRLCLALAATVLVALLAEHRPAEWLVAEFDRISLPQLCIALLAAGCFAVAERCGAAPRWRRAAVCGVAAVTAIAALVLLFPGVLRGPLANADEAYLRLLHPSIQENLPLPPFGPGSLSDLGSFVGGAVFAGLLAIAIAMPGWRRDGTWPAGLLLLIVMLAGLGATLGARRFGMDLAPPASIAAAGLVGLLLHGRWMRWLAAPAAMVLLVATLGLPFLGLMSGRSATAPAMAAAGCDWTAMDRWLGAERPLVGPRGAAPVLIASDIFEGPEIVWRTPYRVVTTPHHRAGPAIADSFAIFGATDPAAAHAILRRRGVDLLLVCARGPDGDRASNSLAGMVRDGRQPEWLRPIPLPAALGGFRLMAVDR